MNLPKDYISYNQIRLYQVCPRKYNFAYVKEIDTPISDKIFLGMVFHTAVEEFFKQRITGQEPDQQVILDIFRGKFTSMQEEREVTWELSREETEKRGLSFVQHFLKKIAPDIDPLMVEKELEVELPGIGVNLRGIIDLVEKDFSITDFKTTTQKWSKERIKSSYLQMVIYKYLFEQSFGSVISELKIRILYAKNDSPIKNQLVVRNADDFEFNKMLDVIKYVVENISNGVFYKNEGFFCGFCEYKDLCSTTR